MAIVRVRSTLKYLFLIVLLLLLILYLLSDKNVLPCTGECGLES